MNFWDTAYTSVITPVANAVSDTVSDIYESVVGKMPDVSTVGDNIVAKGGEGLFGNIAQAYTNNPWLGTATAAGAAAALQYANQKDEQKAQRELYDRKHEQDLEYLERKNAMDNERYWVQPGTLDRNRYNNHAWVTLPEKDNNNRYPWRNFDATRK